jgi:hypothetical protein
MRLGRLIARTRKVAAIAAMFSILLQLAIAATHHHADLFGATFALSGQTVTIALPDDGSAPPADESTCQICLGLAFGTAFILPTVLVLDLPPAADAASAVVQRAPDARTQLAFRSRAPPHRL